MSQGTEPKRCGSCDFVALSHNELDEHLITTGHKKPGLLQLDLGGSFCNGCGRKRGFVVTLLFLVELALESAGRRESVSFPSSATVACIIGQKSSPRGLW